jgi:hypothetical protein
MIALVINKKEEWQNSHMQNLWITFYKEFHATNISILAGDDEHLL